MAKRKTNINYQETVGRTLLCNIKRLSKSKIYDLVKEGRNTVFYENGKKRKSRVPNRKSTYTAIDRMVEKGEIEVRENPNLKIIEYRLRRDQFHFRRLAYKYLIGNNSVFFIKSKYAEKCITDKLLERSILEMCVGKENLINHLKHNLGFDYGLNVYEGKIYRPFFAGAIFCEGGRGTAIFNPFIYEISNYFDGHLFLREVFTENQISVLLDILKLSPTALYTCLYEPVFYGNDYIYMPQWFETIIDKYYNPNQKEEQQFLWLYLYYLFKACLYVDVARYGSLVDSISRKGRVNRILGEDSGLGNIQLITQILKPDYVTHHNKIDSILKNERGKEKYIRIKEEMERFKVECEKLFQNINFEKKWFSFHYPVHDAIDSTNEKKHYNSSNPSVTKSDRAKLKKMVQECIEIVDKIIKRTEILKDSIKSPKVNGVKKFKEHMPEMIYDFYTNRTMISVLIKDQKELLKIKNDISISNDITITECVWYLDFFLKCLEKEKKYLENEDNFIEEGPDRALITNFNEILFPNED